MTQAIPVVWKMSRAWSGKKIACNLEGIQNACGGRCCKSATFWPPSSGRGGCPELTDTGCSFDRSVRPVICLLYPYKLNANGTLVLHGRALTGHCKPSYNYGDAKPIFEEMRENLIELFGEEQVAQAAIDIEQGRDPALNPSKELLERIKLEEQQEEDNAPPTPRGKVA